ncbi:MAG: putative Ig domain-containing protein, partial [Cyclobacteriaceae bacterium]
MKFGLSIILCYLTVLCYSQVTINPIPDQLVGRGGSFNTIALDGYTSSSNIAWEVAFVAPESPVAKPTATVNPNKFQFQMTVTARINSKGVDAVGNSHLLYVVDNTGALRGQASAFQVGTNWVYFLTVYSNTNGEELTFKFYDDNLKQILSGEDKITFSSNAITGEPDNPFVVNATTLKLALTGNNLAVLIKDLSFFGTEKVRITARSLSDANDAASHITSFTVVNDYVPVIAGIPDQIKNFDQSFQSFDLDNFTTLQDADPVTFTFSGNQSLGVAIDANNVVTLTKPANWFGLETITFTVTDQSANTFSSSQSATFRGKPIDQPPVVSAIGNRTTGTRGNFEQIDLSNFVTSANPASIVWDFEFTTDSAVADPNWTVNSNQFQFNMSVTVSAKALGKKLVGNTHTVAAFSGKTNQVIGATKAISVNNDWFYFLTVNNNDQQDSVYFKVYDKTSQRILPVTERITFAANSVVGDPLDPYLINAGYLFPVINQNILSFTLRDTDWIGDELLKLTATDTDSDPLLSDSHIVTMRVLNTKPPILKVVPTQTVAEGSVFPQIDLATNLTNLTPSQVTWSISGADTLSPVLTNTVLSFSLASEHYFGEETLVVRAASIVDPNLFDDVSIKLATTNINDAPTFKTEPSAIANLNELYEYNIVIEDLDNDALTLTTQNLPSWLFFVRTAEGGKILGTPTISNSGSYNFELVLSDGQVSVNKAVAVTVASAQISAIADQQVQEGQTFNQLVLSDYLTKFGTINIEWSVSQGSALVFTISDNDKLDVTIPNIDWFGSETVKVTLKNADNGFILDSKDVVYTVTNINDAPTITSTPSDNAAEGVTYTYSLVTEDVDQDQLTITFNTLPDWLTFIPNPNGGTIVGTPQAINAGSNSFQIVVSDGVETVTQNVNILVGSVQISPIADQTVTEGSTFLPIDLDTYAVVSGPFNLRWTLGATQELTASIDLNNNLIVTIPSTDWFGSETITVNLLNADNDEILDTRGIKYTVTNINDAPTITSTPITTAAVGVTYSYAITTQDIDGDVLTTSAQNLPSWLSLITNSTGGTILGTPTAANAGSNQFQISVSDGVETVIQTVDVLVISVKINAIPDKIVDEGNSFAALNLDGYRQVFGTFNLGWTVASGTELTTSVNQSNELIVMIPNADWFGRETITVNLVNLDNDEVLDSRGINYIVNNINDAPTITSTPSNIAAIGATYSYAITTQDVDGDALTVSTANLPSWLTLITNQNGGTILGTPTAANAGSNQFQISVSDGVETVTQAVDVLVISVKINAIPDQIVDEGNSFAALNLDGYRQVFGTFNLGWTVASGTELTTSVNQINELIVTIPNADWFGRETITVNLVNLDNDEVLDSRGINYIVNNINDAPTITSTPSNIAAIGATYSYAITTQDIDGDALTVSTANLPSWLTLITNQNGGTIVGTPTVANAGNHSFQVIISDGDQIVTQTINILVASVKISSIADQTI